MFLRKISETPLWIVLGIFFCFMGFHWLTRILVECTLTCRYQDSFKDPIVVSAVERLAVNGNDSKLLMSLLTETPLEMSFKALSVSSVKHILYVNSLEC
jgi:hypothetical protein